MPAGVAERPRQEVREGVEGSNEPQTSETGEAGQSHGREAFLQSKRGRGGRGAVCSSMRARSKQIGSRIVNLLYSTASAAREHAARQDAAAEKDPVAASHRAVQRRPTISNHRAIQVEVQRDAEASQATGSRKRRNVSRENGEGSFETKYFRSFQIQTAIQVLSVRGVHKGSNCQYASLQRPHSDVRQGATSHQAVLLHV